MSLDSIHTLALASGWRPPKTEARPSEAPPVPPQPAPSRGAPAAMPGAHRRPIDIASLSIAPRSSVRSDAPWVPPSSSPASTPRPVTSAGPIDLASLSIAPWNPERPKGRKRARHEDLYAITPEELAERLEDRRQSRRLPSRKRGEITNQHRIAMAMEPGIWYTSPVLECLAEMPLHVVTANLARMRKWPRLYLERRELPNREAPYSVPAPFGRGGRTLRTPAQFMYSLTENGKELRLEALALAARADG